MRPRPSGAPPPGPHRAAGTAPRRLSGEAPPGPQRAASPEKRRPSGAAPPRLNGAFLAPRHGVDCMRRSRGRRGVNKLGETSGEALTLRGDNAFGLC
jgi:hypothetical protein